MKDAIPMAGLWRKAYINFGELVKEDIVQFKIVQQLEAHNEGCPQQCNPVSVTNIRLDCEHVNSFKMDGKHCKEKEIQVAGCFVDAFRPYEKGIIIVITEINLYRIYGVFLIFRK